MYLTGVQFSFSRFRLYGNNFYKTKTGQHDLRQHGQSKLCTKQKVIQTSYIINWYLLINFTFWTVRYHNNNNNNFVINTSKIQSSAVLSVHQLLLQHTGNALVNSLLLILRVFGKHCHHVYKISFSNLLLHYFRSEKMIHSIEINMKLRILSFFFIWASSCSVWCKIHK